jgi:hypothetical protein
MLATNDTISVNETTDLTGELQTLMGWHFRETSREHPVEVNLCAASKTGPVKVHLELAPGSGKGETLVRPMLFVDARGQFSHVGVYVEIIGAGTVEGNLIPA